MFDWFDASILALTAFFTATISGAMGFLGGTILLSVMAQVVSVQVLVPLHGAVQFWSNGSRVLFLLKHVNWKIFFQYSIGLVIGSFLAFKYLVSIDEGIYNLVLGIFIITVTLMPKPKKGIRFKGKWFTVGFVSSFMGLFMGAVGTFVGAMFLSEPFEKRVLVATQAMCQTLLHFSKIIVFTFIGFKLLDWWPLLALMIMTTTLGSMVGVRILEKVPQELFIKILKTLVVLLALKLVYNGVMNLFQLVG